MNKRDPLKIDAQAQTMSAVVNHLITKEKLSDFTLEELAKTLKSKKCPYGYIIGPYLKGKNLIIPTTGRRFIFAKMEPIHFNEFRHIIVKKMSYNKKYTDKKAEPTSEYAQISEAVEFLKNKGYRILVPRPVEYDEL